MTPISSGTLTALTVLAALLPLSATPTTAQEPAPGAETATPNAEKTPIPLVRFSGSYADLAELGGDFTALLLGGGGKPKPFYQMREQLEAVAEHDSDTVLFDLSDSFGMNQAQLAEIERTFKKLKKAGKKCYAYLEHAGPTQLEIAALCDEVVMADIGTLDLPSAALSVTHLKDAMDLLGVQMDIVRCGDFKGAVEPFMLSSMSDHLKQHYREMLRRMNDDRVRRIAKGRDLSIAEVRAAQSTRLLLAEEAKARGLVDKLVPWQGAERALKIALGRDDFELEAALEKPRSAITNPMQILAKLLHPKKDEEVEEPTVVVLHLSGGIVDGKKPMPGSIVSDPSVATIRKLTENDNVEAVVVRINSPGGSATASEAVLLALRELAAAKPVAVSMGRVAASGGYYITCFGRPIFAEPGTITGSIGVFGMKPNVGALMRRIGVHEELVALDESASMASLDKPWTDAQKQRVQSLVNRIYDVFVGHVSRSRNMTASEVLAIAGGRVWSGEQAKEHGLVDHIGGLDDALALVAKQAGIDGDYEVRHMPRAKNFFETMASEMFEIGALGALLPDLRARLLAGRHTGLDRALRLLNDALVQERPTTVWALMPQSIEVR